MIYSRFGSEFEIVSGDMDTGRITAKRKSDGKLFEDTCILDYKADGGIQEIEAAIRGTV